MLNANTLKLAIYIRKIISEHNKIWQDISSKHNSTAGYNCFDIPEDQIHIIASGLDRKGIK